MAVQTNDITTWRWKHGSFQPQNPVGTYPPKLKINSNKSKCFDTTICLLTDVTVSIQSGHRFTVISQSVVLRHLLLKTFNTLWSDQTRSHCSTTKMLWVCAKKISYYVKTDDYILCEPPVVFARLAWASGKMQNLGYLALLNCFIKNVFTCSA